MDIGMWFHRMAPPRPPRPNFKRTIPSTISLKEGFFDLTFYVPRDYETQRMLWINRPELDGAADDPEEPLADDEESNRSGNSMGKTTTKDRLVKMNTISEFGQAIRRRSTSRRRWGGYPVVINFHGGGFTLGNAWDDARWCQTVVNECNAVVVSVDYRRAPEDPFPIPVEDGVDAVIYIYKHADELGIDRDKIALSGFSSGGNMCFTVPLRLYDEMHGFPRDEISGRPPTRLEAMQRSYYGKANAPSDTTLASSATRVAEARQAECTDVQDYAPNHGRSSPTSSSHPLNRHDTIESITEHRASIPKDIKIACIVPWYPPVDYTRSREQRRATMRRPDQELAALFTNLFDESYLHPPHTISLDSPYLSPGVAPTSLLKPGLPEEIVMHTCEWDMLLDEGEVFRDRLVSPELGKKVWYKMVEGVPHGWDKAPNPIKPTPGVKEHYLKACKEMRRVFGAEKGVPAGSRPRMERRTTKGYPTMAPRESVSMVR